MPLKSKPICAKCEKTETPLWHQTEQGILCSDCERDYREQLKNPNLKKEKEDTEENVDCASNSSETKNENGNTKTLRRSTRTTRYYKTRLNPFALPKTMLPKGKGRRIIFKKTPTKAPTAVATPVTSDSVFYKVGSTFIYKFISYITCIFANIIYFICRVAIIK